MSGTNIPRAALMALNTTRTAQDIAAKTGRTATDGAAAPEPHSLARARAARNVASAGESLPASYPLHVLTAGSRAADGALGDVFDQDLDSEAVRLLALKAQQQLAVETVSIANAEAIGIISLFRSTREISLM